MEGTGFPTRDMKQRGEKDNERVENRAYFLNH